MAKVNNINGNTPLKGNNQTTKSQKMTSTKAPIDFKNKSKPVYRISQDKVATLVLLSNMQNKAKEAFNKQLADDGFAGDLADGISALWGSKNRASLVRKDLKNFDNNLKKLNKAAQISDAEFEKIFRSIAGDYNQTAINTYKKNPTDENFKKAFPKLMNSTKRVADYNQSQQTGAAVVKTTGKLAAGAAAGAAIVATGGLTGVAALGVTAAATAAASVTIDEADRTHITGQHKDFEGKTVKDKGTFRGGTNHGKIFKDAAIAGASVIAGGGVGLGAKALAAGSKATQISLNVAGDITIGAVAEFAQTGKVSVQESLMNAGFSALGASVASGALKEGIKKVIRNFKSSSKPKAKYKVPQNKKEEYELVKAKLRASNADKHKTPTARSLKQTTSQNSAGIEIVRQTKTPTARSLKQTTSQNSAGIEIVRQTKTPTAKPAQHSSALSQQSTSTQSSTSRLSQQTQQKTSSVTPEENIGSFNERVPDYRLANNGKVPWRNSKTSINKGQEIELRGDQTISLSTDTYTADGYIRNENITLNANGAIQYSNGYQYQLKNGEYYIYESSPGVYKKIEYKHEPFKVPKVKVTDANKQEYDVFRKVEYATNVAKYPVKRSISLASIGTKTVDIPGTNYTVTGRPNGVGFVVKNKVTGEHDFVGNGEQIKFQDGSTASCTYLANKDVAIRITAKRNN